MGNAHLARAFLRFLWRSKNEHGVHSPFVFSLLTQCFYDKKKHPEYEALRSYRRALLTDSRNIEVTDFGAGSRVFRSNRRKVSDIAKNAGISYSRAKMLFRLTRYFNTSQILEIGTSVGLGTQALALGAPDAQITTIEGCPQTAAIAKKMLGNYTNVNVQVGEFSDVIPLWQPDKNANKLVYFDGNHSEAATLTYVNLLLPLADEHTVWIFDDIHWSEEMTHAWQKLCSIEEITVSLDLFRWGIVFFRPKQTKEHFILRTPAIF